MNRASPSQQRKALEIAHLFVQYGVGFVPMPVSTPEEFEIVALQSLAKMNEIVDSMGATDQASAPTGDSATQQHSAQKGGGE